MDSFIYTLKENGLLLRESHINFSTPKYTISLHRSIQQICFMFLVNTLNQNDQIKFMNKVMNLNKDFYELCKINKDFYNMKLLTYHLKALLKSIKNMNIPDPIKNRYEIDLHLMLGRIYHKWDRNLILARKMFKISLEKNNHYLQQSSLAKLFNELCSTCLSTNFLEEGVTYCKKSIHLCNTLNNSQNILSNNFRYLGEYERRKGNFHKSEYFLKKALKISREKELKAEIYSQLSVLHFMHNLNKKTGAIATKYAIKALEIIAENGFVREGNKNSC